MHGLLIARGLDRPHDPRVHQRARVREHFARYITENFRPLHAAVTGLMFRIEIIFVRAADAKIHFHQGRSPFG